MQKNAHVSTKFAIDTKPRSICSWPNQVVFIVVVLCRSLVVTCSYNITHYLFITDRQDERVKNSGKHIQRNKFIHFLTLRLACISLVCDYSAPHKSL